MEQVVISSRNACVCWVGLILPCRSHPPGSPCLSSCTVQHCGKCIYSHIRPIPCSSSLPGISGPSPPYHLLSSLCPCAFLFLSCSAFHPPVFFKRQATGWHRAGESFTERPHRVSLTFSVCSPKQPWQRLLLTVHSLPCSAGMAREGTQPQRWPIPGSG